jgi:hypothetical protein
MGDNASQCWDLSDAKLLTHFDLSYPQLMPWQLYHPNSVILSAVTSMLHRKWSLPESFLTEPPLLADSGPDGCSSAEPYCWIHSLAMRLDPITILQVYAHRYCTGELAPRGHPVSSRTVEDALHAAVDQMLMAMGANDIHLNSHGKIDFHLLKCQMAGNKRQDPPPNRVKPIPIQILHHIITSTAYATDDPGNHAIANMIIIAFFFLLCPGEYTGTALDTCPFRLADVQLWTGSLCASAVSMPLADHTHITFGTLMFMSQKNGFQGEFIGSISTGHPPHHLRSSLTYVPHHSRSHHHHLLCFRRPPWSIAWLPPI